MTTATSLSLRRWSAWAPGLSTIESWTAWAEAGAPLPASGEKPKAGFLSPSLRRRCSAMTRAALEAAFACVPPEERSSVRSVFASRHGEAETTLSILETLALGEIVSPMDFSLSVHNAASGLFSIAAANRLPSIAVAAGGGTLLAALVEARNALLSCGNGESVLCVIAEEPLPAVFRREESGEAAFFALALHLSPEPGELSLSIVSGEEDRAPRADEADLVRWLIRGAGELEIGHGATKAVLSRAGGSFADLFAGS